MSIKTTTIILLKKLGYATIVSTIVLILITCGIYKEKISNMEINQTFSKKNNITKTEFNGFIVSNNNSLTNILTNITEMKVSTKAILDKLEKKDVDISSVKIHVAVLEQKIKTVEDILNKKGKK